MVIALGGKMETFTKDKTDAIFDTIIEYFLDCGAKNWIPTPEHGHEHQEKLLVEVYVPKGLTQWLKYSWEMLGIPLNLQLHTESLVFNFLIRSGLIFQSNPKYRTERKARIIKLAKEIAEKMNNKSIFDDFFS